MTLTYFGGIENMSYSFLLVSGKANTVTVPVGSASNGQSAVLHRKNSTLSSTGVIANGKATFDIATDRVTEFAGSYSITVGGSVIQNGDIDIIVAAASGGSSGGDTGNVDLSNYPTKTQVNTTVASAVSAKADKSYVDAGLAIKAGLADLNNKVDLAVIKPVATTGVYGDLTGKPDLTGFETVAANTTKLAAKANITDLNTALSNKVSFTDLSTAVANKVDTSTVNTALGLKANAADVIAQLASKLDKSVNPITSINGIVAEDDTGVVTADFLTDDDLSTFIGPASRAVSPSASSTSSTSVTVTWTLPSIIDGITGWEVRYRQTGTLTFTSTPVVAATATSSVVTGLTSGTSYDFEVSPRYIVVATPAVSILVGDEFPEASATWSSTSARTAKGGSTSTDWLVSTASTQSPTFSIKVFSGIALPDTGNKITTASLDSGAASGRRYVWKWSTLNSDLTKRNSAASFRTSSVTTTGANDQWYVTNEASGYWVVNKLIGGTATRIFTSTVTRAASDILEVITGANNLITVNVNGSLLWSGTDADLATNTRFGWRFQAQATDQTYSQDGISRLDYIRAYAA